MVLPPMRYKSGRNETISYFESIAKSTNLPIMIYNNPVDYGIEVTIDMFEELLKCNNIKFLVRLELTLDYFFSRTILYYVIYAPH